MIIPKQNFVLIEKIEQQSPQGIIKIELLPDYKRDTHIEYGKVIAVGSGRLSKKGVRLPVQVNIGDIVVYKSFLASKIKDNEKEFRLIPDADIIGTYGE